MARRFSGWIGVVAVAALVAACARSDGAAALPVPVQAPPVQQVPSGEVNVHAKAMHEMQERVKAYLALHDKLEKTLAPLPKEATPEQIHKHQLALASLIRNARRTAKPGDIFVPDVRIVIRTLMKQVFGGPDGKQLRASVMDENPGRLKIAVNDRYPDSVPLSTVPPQVLQGLPRLPAEMEYRFIGRALILFDVHAHIIVDVMENAIP